MGKRKERREEVREEKNRKVTTRGGRKKRISFSLVQFFVLFRILRSKKEKLKFYGFEVVTWCFFSFEFKLFVSKFGVFISFFLVLR